jgi:hypothetical protein
MIPMMLTHEVDQVYLAIRRLEVALNQVGNVRWSEVDQLAEKLEKAATALKEEIKK